MFILNCWRNRKMRWSKIKLLMLKDLKFLMGNKRIFIPLMVTPLSLLVFTPIVTFYGLSSGEMDKIPLPKKFMSNLPEQIVNQISGFSQTEQMIYLFANYVMAVLFLLLPLMICSSISAASIIQEKENNTMETLLYAPITKIELFLGKILGTFIPSLVATYIGLITYLGIVYTFTSSTFDAFILQEFWLYLTVFLLPVTLLFAVTANILASSKAKSQQEAQQFSIIITFPFMMVLVGQFMGSLYITSNMIITLSIVFFIIDITFIYIIAKKSSNEGILKM